MWLDQLNTPVITIPLGILSSAFIGYIVIALKSRGQQAEGRMLQQQLRATLENIQLQSQIDEARRDEAKALILATQQTLADQGKQLESVSIVATEAQHASNGATTEMLRVEQELRTKITTVETAARTAENTAQTAMETAKELSRRDIGLLTSQLATANEKIAVLTAQLQAANDKIAVLTQQLNTMAQQSLPAAQASSPAPQPVVGTESGQPVPVTVVP